MGAIATHHADIAIITSDNPRTEDPEQIITEIKETSIAAMEIPKPTVFFSGVTK